MFPNYIQFSIFIALLSCYCKCAREISYKNQIHAISGHYRPVEPLIWKKRSKICKIWRELENILGYFVKNSVKILENSMRKVQKRLEKVLEKSLSVQATAGILPETSMVFPGCSIRLFGRVFTPD